MPIIQDPNISTNLLRVEVGGTQRVTTGIIGDRYSQGNITSTMAAALGANSTIYAMRFNPSSSKMVRIHRIRLLWTTVVAFTVPVTAGRRLGVFKGTGAAASGGTSLGVSPKRDTNSPSSQCDIAQGGDQRIASTVALTTTGITYDAQPFKIMTLSHVGSIGNYGESIYEFDDDTGGPLILRPGELMAIRNPVAMDALGTWQLGVNVDWTEIQDLA